MKIIQRNNNPLFIEEKIELPEICTTFQEKEINKNTLIENNAQTKLITTTT